MSHSFGIFEFDNLPGSLNDGCLIPLEPFESSSLLSFGIEAEIFPYDQPSIHDISHTVLELDWREPVNPRILKRPTTDVNAIEIGLDEAEFLEENQELFKPKRELEKPVWKPALDFDVLMNISKPRSVIHPLSGNSILHAVTRPNPNFLSTKETIKIRIREASRTILPETMRSAQAIKGLTQVTQEPVNDGVICENHPRVVLIGNTGVGKSTLLNGLIGRVIFRTGISFKTSLTQVTQESVKDGLKFMDTPGFNGLENRAEAAMEIKKALSQGGLYKIVFVMTLESGRFRAIDKKTLNELLEEFSIKDNAYSIIVNKVEQSILNQIADDFENFMAQLHEGPSSKTERVFCLPYDRNIAKNCSLSHLKDQFSDFIRGAPTTEIILDSVKDQDMGKIDDAATRRREKADFEN